MHARAIATIEIDARKLDAIFMMIPHSPIRDGREWFAAWSR
jgi:hypothetical protein